MTPRPEGWWTKVKKYEPTNLVKFISGGLKIASAFNWIGFSQAQLGVIDVNLPLVVPVVLQIAINVGDWVAHRWLRSKVASPVTAEVMAETIVNVEKARATGAPVRVSLDSRRAAARVLKQPEPTPQHSTRINPL